MEGGVYKPIKDLSIQIGRLKYGLMLDYNKKLLHLRKLIIMVLWLFKKISFIFFGRYTLIYLRVKWHKVFSLISNNSDKNNKFIFMDKADMEGYQQC